MSVEATNRALPPRSLLPGACAGTGLPILTADGTWTKADVGADVVVIR